MDFKELKEIALERCRKAGACNTQYARVVACENETELLRIFVDNARWALISGIADGTFIHENFSDEAKNAVGVYTIGVHQVTEGKFFAFRSANVRAYGSANVEAYDSANVEAYDSANVRAFRSANVRAFRSANVRAYDSANVRAYDSANVRAYGSANVEAYDSANVRAYDSANVRAYNTSYVENCTGRGILPQSDYAIVKDYHAHKIYVKKSKFEIIEVE